MNYEENVILNTKTEDEAQRHIHQLKKYGYTRKANCYWTEIFEKDGWIVQLNRDF